MLGCVYARVEWPCLAEARVAHSELWRGGWLVVAVEFLRFVGFLALDDWYTLHSGLLIANRHAIMLMLE